MAKANGLGGFLIMRFSLSKQLTGALLLGTVVACGGGSSNGQGTITPAPFAIQSTLALVEKHSSEPTSLAIIFSTLPIECANIHDEITLPAPNDVTTFTLAPPGDSFSVGTFERASSDLTPLAFEQLRTRSNFQEPLDSVAGTMNITSVGSSVQGTFQVQMVQSSDNSDAGTYSGTFDAPL